MYVVKPSLSQKWVALACLEAFFVHAVEIKVNDCSYVTPLPNQECVSSCTTTSTNERSPASRADKVRYLVRFWQDIDMPHSELRTSGMHFPVKICVSMSLQSAMNHIHTIPPYGNDGGKTSKS